MMPHAATLRVGILDSAPRGQRGSMARYAALLAEAAAVSGAPVAATLLPLGLDVRTLARLPSHAATWLNHAAVACRARRAAARFAGDLLHFADGSHAFALPARLRRPTVITAHDVIPALQMAGRFGARPVGRFAPWLIRRSLAALGRANAVVCVSDHTRRDLIVLGLPPERLTVVHSAVALVGPPPASTPGVACGPPYLLHVGHSGFYKNRAAVLSVYARLRREAPVELHLVGAPLTSAERAILDGAGGAESVRVVADAEDATLAREYAGAALLLFPSLYEGFGWPPLEAMACGCPVVCSDAASLPEVTGDAALRAPPDDIDALAAHCRRLLRESAFARELGERGRQHVQAFSLANMGRRLAEVYRAVMDGRGPGTERR